MEVYHNNPDKKYPRYFAMLIVSFFIMYGVMFLNVFQINHIFPSYTRSYMAILMVAPMAISMLLFMWKTYNNIKINISIISGAILLFSFALYGLRNQFPVNDVQWMRAMIPHHSSAILTSENANLKDPEVKQLAREIIETQEREIEEMKQLIKRLKKENSD